MAFDAPSGSSVCVQCAGVVSVMCRLGIRAVWARAERVSLQNDHFFRIVLQLELKPAGNPPATPGDPPGDPQ